MKGITRFSNSLMEKYLPDPFLFVIILTVVIFALGLGLTDSSPVQMVAFWGEGFWALLAFSMQMVLVLVTGFVLASSPIFKKGLGKLASLATSPGSAIVLVTLVSLAASWINWGFGLVIGALFAKELAKRVEHVDYRLLIASAYSGFIIWHAGFSGSIPLSIATEGHPFADKIGIIPTSATIFASYNLIIVVALVIIVPLLNRLMMPKKEDTIAVDPKLLVDPIMDELPAKSEMTPAERLENSWIISMIIGALGIAFIIYYFVQNGFALTLDLVNFMFLFLGIIFHGTPRKYLIAVQEAVRGAGAIIVQFPFYAGIMGMMTASGLAGVMSEAFVNISTADTLPLFAFLSAGLVNFFVPSGGGQWAVQAPIMLEAAEMLGSDPARVAMAVAWGDAWTNMIQPFWALPALAIAGLKAKDIMGFCVIVLVVSGVVIGLGLLFL
ncbi:MULTISPECIES: short-chain fatty acid transporter [Psychrobacter]|jgi:short-chain fatty acids transporter|uniref:short-chain fatty acid transporter n=1 Tax=Psychrobacter TaxID=497 RepID=UPI000EDACC6E|nr:MULTISPECIES: short-chain fatty acid transporter [Psychrobacter]HCN17070.1 short-chain fatty acid transporter [Psychrobacter sp.]